MYFPYHDPPLCSQPTYGELKRQVPPGDDVVACGSQPTYEELKPRQRARAGRRAAFSAYL